jgi:2-haloacid dehalogenase
MRSFDVSGFEVLTFDCYGTLCDWERGLLASLRPLLDRHRVTATGDQVLESFARHEARIEAGPYLRYREVLARTLEGIGEDFGFDPTAPEKDAFGDSVKDWPLFEDSADSIAELSRHFRLGVITNCDDDLFAATNARLGNRFEWVVTAEMARTYKPSLNNFRVALEIIGVGIDRVLHVAQSLYHDHIPAQRIGLKTAWIDRRQDKHGFGATPATTASPDVVAPDMRTFTERCIGDWR